MAKAVFHTTIIDTTTGLPVPNATVGIIDATSGLYAPLWSDRAGTVTVSPNPTTADANGFIEVYVTPGRFRIEADDGSGGTQTWENELLGVPEQGVLTPSMLDIDGDKGDITISSSATVYTIDDKGKHVARNTLTGGGTLIIAYKQAIGDSSTYTLPDTSGLATGDVLRISTLNGATPIIDTFGAEQIVSVSGTADTLSMDALSDLEVYWNGTNWVAQGAQEIYATQSASASSSIDFATGLPVTGVYTLTATNVVFSADNSPRIRVSIDGSTFESGATDYAYAVFDQSVSSASTGDAFLRLVADDAGGAAGETFNMNVTISVDENGRIVATGAAHYIQKDGNAKSCVISGRYDSTGVVGVQFYPSTGTITSGEFMLRKIG